MASFGDILFSWRQGPEAEALPFARMLQRGAEIYAAFVGLQVLLVGVVLIFLAPNETFAVGFGGVRWRLADYGIGELGRFAIGSGLVVFGVALVLLSLFWLGYIYDRWRQGDRGAVAHLWPFGGVMTLSGLNALFWVGLPAEHARLMWEPWAGIPILFGLFFLVTAWRAHVQIRRDSQVAAVAPAQ